MCEKKMKTGAGEACLRVGRVYGPRPPPPGVARSRTTAARWRGRGGCMRVEGVGVGGVVLHRSVLPGARTPPVPQYLPWVKTKRAPR